MAIILYRIRNWDSLFENHRTRALKHLDWVAVPNKHDSDGFTDLMSRDDGPALYGAWILILQVASKCEDRGILARGNPAISGAYPPKNASNPAISGAYPPKNASNPAISGAYPHTASSISRITRCPERLVQRALDVCSDELGWIEKVYLEEPFTENGAESGAYPPKNASDPAISGGDPALSRDSTRARDRTEGKGTHTQEGREQNGREGKTPTQGAGVFPAIQPSARFGDWWQLWSSVKGTANRAKAEEAYRSTVPTAAELDCFECTASYLESLDNPARGFNPHNFLTEQAKDRFRPRWPVSTKGNRSETQSIVEKTLALMQSRIERGKPPL